MPGADRTTTTAGTPEMRAMVADVERAWGILHRLNALPPGDFAAMREALEELTGHPVDPSVRVLPRCTSTAAGACASAPACSSTTG